MDWKNLFGMWNANVFILKGFQIKAIEIKTNCANFKMFFKNQFWNKNGVNLCVVCNFYAREYSISLLVNVVGTRWIVFRGEKLEGSKYVIAIVSLRIFSIII